MNEEDKAFCRDSLKRYNKEFPDAAKNPVWMHVQYANSSDEKCLRGYLLSVVNLKCELEDN